MAKKKEHNNNFCISAGACRLPIYGSFNKGVLGLEKSKKRHPNAFNTRQIAIKPQPFFYPVFSFSRPHNPPPPPPLRRLKKRSYWQQQKVLDSRTLQRSYFVTQNWKENKHEHKAGKTFQRSSEDFCLFGKSLESFLPGKGRWHPSLSARVHFQIVGDSQTSLWIRDLPVVILKRSMQIYIEFLPP